MKLSALFIFFIIFVPFCYGQEYHIPLLAVKELPDGTFKGSSADLYLEIRDQGRGRVFLDTYPLTKLDTQMSTRFAKEIACSQLDFDCDSYDFIYTIQSDSVIVGGPSAGAAITLLTIAALNSIDLKEDISITGTINSGGLIGPVGGLKEKIEAASDQNLKKVLIPHGEVIEEIENKTNESINSSKNNKSEINLIDYGHDLGIEVVEVGTINEAIYQMTGKIIESDDVSLDINEQYLKTMESVTQGLCKRSNDLKENLSDINFTEEDEDIFENAINLTERSKKAVENKKFYSAASYCFGANTKLSYLQIKNDKITNSEILTKITEVKSKIKTMNNQLKNRTIKTITDLETYMVVKERVDEAEESVNKVIDIKNLSSKIDNLAYSIERLNSAVSWSNFFDKGTKKYMINKDEIKNSCINKIYEAEERNEYLKLITAMNFETTEKDIGSARLDLENESYELCLFKASKAKAESDVILNTIGIDESQLLETTEQRLDVIRKNLIKEQQKGIFPVVGYSYYEYANDLKDKDIYSSMLFTEYSLELSNLDIYFKDNNESKFNLRLDIKYIIGISLTFISGILIGLGIGKIKPKKHSK